MESAPYFLFTSFRGGGEDGLYLALSRDGFRWVSLTQGRPWATCEALQTTLLRDPCLTLGPDGLFHLVFTRGSDEHGPVLGYARSADLLTWTHTRIIPVMREFAGARNAWAPEVFWDEAQKNYLLLWASTVEGRFVPIPREPGREGFDHRIFATRTQDWETFTPTVELFDPGHSATAPTIVAPQSTGESFRLVFKDDRWEPRQKCLRFAEADKPDGPYRNVSAPITGEGADGPSSLVVGEWTYIYYERTVHDRERPSTPVGYGAIRTRDWQTWEDVSARMAFPTGHRQGTALEIDLTVARPLLWSSGVTLEAPAVRAVVRAPLPNC